MNDPENATTLGHRGATYRDGALHRPRPDTRPARGGPPRGFRGLMDSGAFVNGPAVARFEEAFAAETGVRRCVGIVERPRRAAYRAARGGPRARRGGDRSGDDLRRDARGCDTGRRRSRRRRHPGRRSRPRPGRRRRRRDRRARASCSPSISTGSSRTCGRLAVARPARSIEDACQAPGAVRDGLRARDAAGSRRRSASTRRRTSAPSATPERS